MAFFSDESKRKYTYVFPIYATPRIAPHTPMLIIVPLSLYYHLPQVE